MPTAQKHVDIDGGGIAALEAQAAAHGQAEQRVRVTLVAPEDDVTLEVMRTGDDPMELDSRGVRRSGGRHLAWGTFAG